MSPTERQELIEEGKAFPAKKKRRDLRFLVMSSALIVAFGLMVGYAFSDQSGESAKDQRLSALETAYEAQRAQFIECKDGNPNDPNCQTPVAPPVDEIKPVPSEDGKTSSPTVIVRAIQPGQIDAAVLRYCSATKQCNGKDATVAQIRSAVAQYCNANGKCTPPAPKDGKDGTDGENAPPITSQQIDSSVVSYCSQDSEPCRSKTPGAKGDQGEKGEQGEPGKDFTCPDGFTVQTTEVVTSVLPEERTTLYSCRAGTGG